MASYILRPFEFVRRMAVEKPSYTWAIGIGLIGPIGVVVIPPIRRKYFGYVPPEHIPTTYPMPKRLRNPPSGFEDPE
ncbi:11008_t:CDS:2 [Funneliformis geosporum]|uniref:5218_t:CDS:1 n=1 Tax=Funneliformis geosporum TaxID=1117311 RepID=A0A9W4WPC8_9GLOM|nr:11008_t:CDS:2 [Funneliformis geosporum]CAI2176239.1 5218_t:CDS:2 [Funneliformis geosporum]